MMMSGKQQSKTDFAEAEIKLSSLALAGLINKKITFTHGEVLYCCEKMTKSRFGFLSEGKTKEEHGDTLYHFNHMTRQEYLGARCLATDPDFIEKLSKCVSIMGIGEHTCSGGLWQDW